MMNVSVINLMMWCYDYFDDDELLMYGCIDLTIQLGVGVMILYNEWCEII